MIKYKKITHNIEGLLPRLVIELKKDTDIIFAYLFGSQAKGDIGSLSDIDIAILVGHHLWCRKAYYSAL